MAVTMKLHFAQVSHHRNAYFAGIEQRVTSLLAYIVPSIQPTMHDLAEWND